MKSKKYLEKRKFIQEEKKKQKKYGAILILLGILGAIYFWYFRPTTIGHNLKYNIFIFWTPTILGISLMAFYRRKFLLNQFTRNKSFILWVLLTLFYLSEGVIFSYLSFGQLADITWNIVNKRISNESPRETFDCQVTNFDLGGHGVHSKTLRFDFKTRSERVYISNETSNMLSGKKPEKYKIRIECRKGIWDYYTLTDWTLIEK